MDEVNGAKPLSERLTFNFKAITAKQIAELRKGFAEADTDKVAGIYAQIVTECPPEWGAASDPETYLRLPFYGEFQDIMTAMAEASKNVKRP